MTLRVVTETPNVRLAVAGSLIIGHSFGEIEAGAMRLLDEVQGQVSRSQGHFSTMLVVTSLQSRPPDVTVRVAGSELTRKYEQTQRASAIVVLSKGLSSVMVRTLLSGYFMFTQTGNPQKVFNTVGDALSWLKGLPGAEPSLQDPQFALEVAALLAL